MSNRKRERNDRELVEQMREAEAQQAMPLDELASAYDRNRYGQSREQHRSRFGDGQAFSRPSFAR